MDAARLVEGYKSIMRTVYNSGEYYQRALECLRRVPQDGPPPNKHNVFTGAAAVARITLKLGVLDRERREFWRYFTKSLGEHREKFAMSMRLAAMGYHFRKLVEAYGEQV
jgi:hypothetical protein